MSSIAVTQLEAWLQGAWWPPCFAGRGYRWRPAIYMSTAVCLVGGWYGGKGHGMRLMVITLSVLTYIGLPLLFFLLGAWRSKTATGRRFAHSLCCGLLIAGSLVPSNFLGGYLLSFNMDRTKRAGDRIAAMVEQYRETKGYLPASLQALSEAAGPLPSPPFAVWYRASVGDGWYELKIIDPDCLRGCFWLYDPRGREWHHIAG